MDAVGIFVTIAVGIGVLGGVYGIIGRSEYRILSRMDEGFRELERKLERTFELRNQ